MGAETNTENDRIRRKILKGALATGALGAISLTSLDKPLKSSFAQSVPWSSLGGKPFVTIGNDGTEDYPATYSGVQDWLDQIPQDGETAIFLPNVIDLGPSQLIVPNDRPWGMISASPSSVGDNGIPPAIYNTGTIIRSSTSDWILKTNGTSYNTGGVCLIQDIHFANYGPAFAGGLNLRYLDPMLKGYVKVQNESGLIISGSKGVTTGPQASSIQTCWDTIAVIDYDIGFDFARDHTRIGIYNYAVQAGNVTCALQHSDSSNTNSQLGQLIDYMHINVQNGRTLQNAVARGDTSRNNGIAIDHLVLERNQSAVISNLYSFGGTSSPGLVRGYHVGTLESFEQAFGASGPKCADTNSYAYTQVDSLSFPDGPYGLSFGYAYTGFTFPGAAGYNNAKTNASIFKLTISQRGQSGTHVVAPGGTIGGPGDYALIDDSTFDLLPAWRLYYTTKVPIATQVYAHSSSI